MLGFSTQARAQEVKEYMTKRGISGTKTSNIIIV